MRNAGEWFSGPLDESWGRVPQLKSGKLLSKNLWRGRSKTLRLYSALTGSSSARGPSQAHLQKVFIGSTVAALPDVLNGFFETQVAVPVEIGHGDQG
jgi:hypothetical protein